MADLSHWDFAENFSGYDAAALILGLEPRDSCDEEWRVRVVAERMELNYKNELHRIFHRTLGEPLENLEHAAPRRIGISSIKLHDLDSRNWYFDEETPLSDWLADKRLTKFENQEFERYSIARWLRQIGIKSVYRFDRDKSDALEAPPGYWPWGNHHTELLGHLEAAAREFWVGYDPQNAKATAPKSEGVIAWLEARSAPGQRKKVSNQMATAIASMLRPDGLPPGPRK